MKQRYYRKKRGLYKFCALVLMLLPILKIHSSEAELLMHTQGTASFAPYVNGIKKTKGLYPGYRAECQAHVDFYKNNNLILTGLVGNMTIISRSDSSVFNLDKIRYTLAPGFRYEFNRWILRGSFHHESLYSLSRIEEQEGAFWQNSIRFGVGTKGSYYLYFDDRYRNVDDTFINSWDIQVNGGVFLHGSKSIWVAKNHNYRYELFSLLRYHVCTFHKWVYFAGLNQHLWIKSDNETEHKESLTLSFFRKGSVNFFGIYYTYTMYDSYKENNENKLGALGIRFIF